MNIRILLTIVICLSYFGIAHAQDDRIVAGSIIYDSEGARINSEGLGDDDIDDEEWEDNDNWEDGDGIIWGGPGWYDSVWYGSEIEFRNNYRNNNLIRPQGSYRGGRRGGRR